MKDTQLRLKKVIGQLTGILKMIEEDQCCDKVTVQFQAAQAALSNTFAKHLESSLSQCLKGGDKTKMQGILRLIAKQ